MKINIEDLSYYGLSDNLPELFRNLKSGEYYCFYYTMDDKTSTIGIVKDFIAVNLNTSLYKDIRSVITQAKTNEVYLGYFTNRLETRDGLLYFLLNSYAPANAVTNFFAIASERDKNIDLRISNSASVDIISRDSFSEALSYFAHPDKVNTILSIYDIVNDYSKQKHNASLYGDVINKVVQLITHDAGVLSENGGTMRYMVVGEQASLNEEQRASLKTAKALLRSLINPFDIYTQTGWHFSSEDGYWRTNISDYEASLDESLMVRVNDYFSFYKPTYCPVSQEQIAVNIAKPLVLFNAGYNGKLSDILKHKSLYQFYPELADMPLIFAYNDSNVFYYQDSSDTFKYINITGNPTDANLLSILLHEVQHAVQGIEGFAKGGNNQLANFVIALGGKGVRPIFASIFNFKKFISTQINTEELYAELKSSIQDMTCNIPSSSKFKSAILNEFMATYEVFKQSSGNVALYLIYLIVDTKVFNEGAIINFLERIYGEGIYDLFEMIKDAIQETDMASKKLLSEGFSKEDVKIINFNTYQNLLGEMEARGTQHQMGIPMNLTNYFFLNEYEKSPTKSIAVIGGKYIKRDISTIVGACEKTQDGSYVLHFKKNVSSIPFIHELGHIVHDILKEIGFGEAIKNEYDKDLLFDDYDEYFVNIFMGYISDNYKDSPIGLDLANNFSARKNPIIYQILDDIFNAKPENFDVIMNVLKEMED
jgi:hypothetical protein